MNRLMAPPDSRKGEAWKPISGYEGLYDISNLGRIRSWSKAKQGALLKSTPTANGYPRISLSTNGRQQAHLVHRLLLIAFVGAPGPGQISRHLNGKPEDCRLDNLAWGTPSENMYDSVRHGTHAEARKTHCPAGHPYDPTGTGYRICRVCRGAREARRALSRNPLRRKGSPRGALTHCRHGHPFDEANTRIRSSGARECRACHAVQERDRRDRRRAESTP